MIVRITSLADLMAVVDKRLSRLKISRSAVKRLPGMRNTEVVNNYFSGRAKDVQFDATALPLCAGLGLEIWVRTIPSTAAEKRKYDEEFARWMAEGGIVLHEDSEVQQEQVFPGGRVPRKTVRGVRTGEDVRQSSQV